MSGAENLPIFAAEFINPKSKMSKKTIVVVGAGQGLGNHIAERFAKEDFRVVLVARRKEALDEYQKEFTEKG